MTTQAPHPYLCYLAAWDRDEPAFFAALDEIAGRPVRFSGLTRSPQDLSDCLAFFRNDPMAAVTESPDGTLLLPGNPHLVLRLLLERHYLPPDQPRLGRARRDLLRASASVRRFFERGPGHGDVVDGCGLRWPDEPRVDRYRRDLFVGLVEERHEPPPGLLDAPWPGGKRYALCLTFEVASPDGMRLVGKALEEATSRGVPPAFFIGTQRELWDHELVGEVSAGGGEVGLLGLSLGANLAHANPGRIRRALDRIQPLVDRHRIVGYRHRSSRVTRPLLEALAERFSYDSSIPDTARDPATAAVRGCALSTPFAIPPMMELPLTLPPDESLLSQGYEGLDFLDLLRRKALAIRERRGVATLAIRLEPNVGGRRVQRDLLGALLGELAELDDVWFATPAQVAGHWQRAMAPGGSGQKVSEKRTTELGWATGEK
jgi:hypothetical protein